ncbi:MAG: ABC transporter permease [Planctomycetota bacterium]|nr:ABC transporter permease [Planctomycetota bacterium]
MRHVWAVAMVFLLEVLRGPGFRVFLVALLASAAFFPRLTAGDDLLERLRLAVSYGIGIPSILIGVATLVYTTGSLSREIDRRTIHLVATKPIHSWRILAGKLCGVFLLDVGLLTLAVLVFLANVWSFSAEEHSPDEWRVAKHRFFVSRRGTFAEPRPVDDARWRVVFESRLARRPPHDRRTEEEIAASVTRNVQTRWIGPGLEERFTFAGLPHGGAPDELLQLRCRLYFRPPDAQVDAATRWTFDAGNGTNVEVRSLRVSQGVVHIVEVPAHVIAEGRLAVRLRNDEPEGRVSLIVRPESLEVLSRHGGLATSLVGVCVRLLGGFVLLAVLGLLGAALFSLPTANLAGFFVYATGSCSAFLAESLELLPFRVGGGNLLEGLVAVLVRVARWALGAMPDFTGVGSLLSRLADGRTVEAAGVWPSLVAASVGFLLAAFFWSRRELGGGQT